MRLGKYRNAQGVELTVYCLSSYPPTIGDIYRGEIYGACWDEPRQVMVTEEGLNATSYVYVNEEGEDSSE